MDSGGYWPEKAAAWNSGNRIYPRYSPSYQTKVVLEKVEDDVPDYRYSGALIRRSTNLEEPYRPFGYVSYYKPVTPPIPVVEPKEIPPPAAVQVPTTTTTGIETCTPKPFYRVRYRHLGYFIMMLAILTFAVELADVIIAAIYKENPCGGKTVSNAFTIPWFFSWVVPGIWGAIPIFITGILAITVKNNYGKVFQALAILASISAFFFAPAIIAINAAELATFFTYCSYKSIDDVAKVPAYKEQERAKFALPIVLIALGILLMLMLLYLTYLLCKSYDDCVPIETIVVNDKKPPAEAAAAVTAVTPVPTPVLTPTPVALPAVNLVPIPSTLPPPPPRDSGRLIVVESQNRGFAYANVPGYFTTQTTTIAKPADTGYYWK